MFPLGMGEPTQTAAGKETGHCLRGHLEARLSAETTGSSGGGSPVINGDGLTGVSGVPIIPGTHQELLITFRVGSDREKVFPGRYRGLSIHFDFHPEKEVLSRSSLISQVVSEKME